MTSNEKVIKAHCGTLMMSYILMSLLAFILKVPLSSREFIIAAALGSINTGIMIFLDLKTINSKDTLFWGLLMKGAKSILLLGMLVLVILRGDVDKIHFTALFFTTFMLSITAEAILFSKIKPNPNKEQQC